MFCFQNGLFKYIENISLILHAAHFQVGSYKFQIYVNIQYSCYSFKVAAIETLMYINVLFLDFHSAFNNLQPHILLRKPNAMLLNPSLCKWIWNFLTYRKEWVKINNT